MSLWWQNLMDRVDAMALRERVLVMVAMLGVIALLWDVLLMQPLDRSQKQLKPEVQGLRAEVSRINQSISEVAEKAQEDPNQLLTTQLEKNKKDLEQINSQLGNLTKGMIAPEEMVEVLKQMLARTAPLQLIELSTLAPEPLAALVPGEILPTQVYRHSVELVLEGRYLDVLEFLDSLEKMPWSFYWDHLDLQVEKHPIVRVRVTVGTLGREEAWIGV